MPRSTWDEYVADITHDADQRRIAERTGVHQTTVSRWLKTKRPGAVLVIQLARAYDANPLEALVAAGYLTDDEVQLKQPTRVDLTGVPTPRLMREIERRTKSSAA